MLQNEYHSGILENNPASFKGNRRLFLRLERVVLWQETVREETSKWSLEGEAAQVFHRAWVQKSLEQRNPVPRARLVEPMFTRVTDLNLEPVQAALPKDVPFSSGVMRTRFILIRSHPLLKKKKSLKKQRLTQPFTLQVADPITLTRAHKAC